MFGPGRMDTLDIAKMKQISNLQWHNSYDRLQLQVAMKTFGITPKIGYASQ
jgi:hypothetical protein